MSVRFVLILRGEMRRSEIERNKLEGGYVDVNRGSATGLDGTV
jgi:hypothetical protein